MESTAGEAPGPADAAGPRPGTQPHRPGPTFLVVKTPTCVWCDKTLAFLKALHGQRGDFQVTVLDASQQPQAFQKIVARTRRTTVPQIFLDGRFVGGWTELAAAAKKGQIDAYLDGERPQAERPGG